MSNKYFVTMAEVFWSASQLARKINPASKIWGIPRGGVPAALAVSKFYGHVMVDSPEQADVIIDDIHDSGATSDRFRKKYGKEVMVLFDKRTSAWENRWLVLPWETADSDVDGASDIVTRLLQYIGEDPKREGLRETPARVLKAWQERTAGYGADPAAILKCFEEGAENLDELVIVHNIPVVSVCEHHMADIVGHAHVGYIPNKRIVGLSKLVRLVNVFAHRLQVQERMTTQIADALMDNLQPVGVGVLVRASHACMSTRGVKVHGSVTTTSAMRGALLEKSAARKEFMDLCLMAERDK